MDHGQSQASVDFIADFDSRKRTKNLSSVPSQHREYQLPPPCLLFTFLSLWTYLIEIAKVELGDRQLTPVCELSIIECPQHLSAVTVAPKKKILWQYHVCNDVSVRRLGYKCTLNMHFHLLSRMWPGSSI